MTRDFALFRINHAHIQRWNLCLLQLAKINVSGGQYLCRLIVNTGTATSQTLSYCGCLLGWWRDLWKVNWWIVLLVLPTCTCPNRSLFSTESCLITKCRELLVNLRATLITGPSTRIDGTPSECYYIMFSLPGRLNKSFLLRRPNYLSSVFFTRSQRFHIFELFECL